VRLARASGRVGDASDADAAIAAAQREPGGLDPAWRRLDANRPLARIVGEIAADLLQRGVRLATRSEPPADCATPST
jgi:predicted kinase